MAKSALKPANGGPLFTPKIGSSAQPKKGATPKNAPVSRAVVAPKNVTTSGLIGMPMGQGWILPGATFSMNPLFTGVSYA